MAPVAGWLLALVSGVLAASPRLAFAERAPHPEPRVIVTVTEIHGPHERAAVQRAARETWGGIVRCYKAHGHGKRGAVVFALEISEAGQISDIQRTGAGDSKLNAEIGACLMRVLSKKTMPTAPSASSATIEIRLAPGNK